MTRLPQPLIALFLAAGLGACSEGGGPAQDELPQGDAVDLVLQDGLWSIAYSSSTSARTLARVCVDPRVDLLLATVNRHIGADCDQQAVRTTDDIIHLQAICPVQGDGERAVSGEASGDLASTFSLTGIVRTQGSRIPTLNGSQNFVSSGSYLGACPDGWRPGDVELEGSTARANLLNDAGPE